MSSDPYAPLAMPEWNPLDDYNPSQDNFLPVAPATVGPPLAPGSSTASSTHADPNNPNNTLHGGAPGQFPPPLPHQHHALTLGGPPSNGHSANTPIPAFMLSMHMPMRSTSATGTPGGTSPGPGAPETGTGGNNAGVLYLGGVPLPAHSQPVSTLSVPGTENNIHGSAQENGQENGNGAGQATQVPPPVPVDLNTPGSRRHVASSAIRVASGNRRARDARFFCEVPGCGSNFTTKSNLQAHTRSHTNERPYICRLGCGKAFTRQSDLSRHEKKIHPDDKTSGINSGITPMSPPAGLEDIPLPVSMGVLPVPGLHGHVDGAEGSISAPVKSGRGTRKRTRKTKGGEGHSVSASGDRRTRSSSPLHSSQLKREVDMDADGTDDQNPSGGGAHEFDINMDLSLDLGSGGGILGPAGSGNGNGHGTSGMTLADVSLDLSMGTNGLGGMGMDDSGVTMRRSHSASPPPSSPPPQRLAIFGPREPLRHRSD